MGFLCLPNRCALFMGIRHPGLPFLAGNASSQVRGACASWKMLQLALHDQRVPRGRRKGFPASAFGVEAHLPLRRALRCPSVPPHAWGCRTMGSGLSALPHFPELWGQKMAQS